MKITTYLIYNIFLKLQNIGKQPQK